MLNLNGLTFNHSDEVRALREALQDFVAGEITPRAAEIDRSNEFPMDLWKKFGDLGLLGMTAEEEYGGTQMGYLAHIIAILVLWGWK